MRWFFLCGAASVGDRAFQPPIEFVVTACKTLVSLVPPNRGIQTFSVILLGNLHVGLDPGDGALAEIRNHQGHFVGSWVSGDGMARRIAITARGRRRAGCECVGARTLHMPVLSKPIAL